jgi:ubiquinone/menaquinone biosynthesis C-methylase UbiE
MELTNSSQDRERSPAGDNATRAPELFDAQAAAFEQRAGLPTADCESIANAVLAIGEMRPGDTIIEVGPGTGQIGQWLVREDVRYVGLDLSAGMLNEFRRRLSDQTGLRAIIRADANSVWPVMSGAARAIFSSRAIHLLDHEHVASEIFRVAGLDGGATLVIGRVEREQESTRALMAREMNERLRRHGIEGRGGAGQKRKLFDALQRRGAQRLEPVVVARWKVSACPRQSINSWRSLASLGGVRVADGVRDQILTELEDWANAVFGGLDQQLEAEETYVLTPLRIRSAQAT